MSSINKRRLEGFVLKYSPLRHYFYADRTGDLPPEFFREQGFEWNDISLVWFTRNVHLINDYREHVNPDDLHIIDKMIGVEVCK